MTAMYRNRDGNVKPGCKCGLHAVKTRDRVTDTAYNSWQYHMEAYSPYPQFQQPEVVYTDHARAASHGIHTRLLRMLVRLEAVGK